MGFFSKDIKSLEDLFLHTLRNMYCAEKKVAKVIPNLVDWASDENLKSVFERHLDETEIHIERLEKVFEMFRADPRPVECPAIEGILDEAAEVSGDIEGDKIMDTALIGAAQAVEHYEITRYGTLAAWARELGRADCAELLEATLREERAADRALTNLAESRINLQSAA